MEKIFPVRMQQSRTARAAGDICSQTGENIRMLMRANSIPIYLTKSFIADKRIGESATRDNSIKENNSVDRLQKALRRIKRLYIFFLLIGESNRDVYCYHCKYNSQHT